MDGLAKLMMVLYFTAGVVVGSAVTYLGPIILEKIDEKTEEDEK